MKILIVKLSAIGDVIHTLPALNAIRAAHPRAHVTWLVERAASALVIGHRALDRVIVCDRKKWLRALKQPGRRQTLREIRGFLGVLRDTHYDAVIDFQSLLKSGLLVGLARGRRKIGFDRGMQHQEQSHRFLNERVPAVDMEIHALTRQMILAETLGGTSRRVVYDLPVSTDDEKRILGLLGNAGVDASRPLTVVHPVAKWATKLWSEKRFAQVADRLAARYGTQVVFTGSREDRAVIGRIRETMATAAADLSGATDLRTLAALCGLAAVVVSTDTGPMHVAAAMGTPVVALFGPTAPWRTGPFGRGHQVIRAGVPCSPCFRRTCDRRRCVCMRRISVDMVLAGVEETRRPGGRNGGFPPPEPNGKVSTS